MGFNHFVYGVDGANYTIVIMRLVQIDADVRNDFVAYFFRI